MMRAYNPVTIIDKPKESLSTEDKRRDHLIGDVIDGMGRVQIIHDVVDGLKGFYSQLPQWDLMTYLATVYRDTGNNQADYEYLRDKAEAWLERLP